MRFTLTSSKDNGHSYSTRINPDLLLEKGNYEIGLNSAMVCYGWANVSADLHNNRVRYRTTSTGSWVIITIPDGTYHIKSLNSIIKAAMKANDHYNTGNDVDSDSDDVYYIEITGNESTGRVRITIRGDYQFDIGFSEIYKLLGFNNNTILTRTGTSTYTDHESPNVPDVNRGVNQIIINCDLVDTKYSYVNGERSQALYSLNPKGVPFSYMEVERQTPEYLPMVDINTIRSIKIYITDQNGNPLQTGGEPTTVSLSIRRV